MAWFRVQLTILLANSSGASGTAISPPQGSPSFPSSGPSAADGNSPTVSPLVLGLDVGTQSLRAALVDPEGQTVAFGVSPIETTHPRPTWAEQDPDRWWEAAC